MQLNTYNSLRAKFSFIILSMLLTFLCAKGYALQQKQSNPINYEFELCKNKKAAYSAGDTIQVKIVATQKNRDCIQGIEKTRIFMKGLKSVYQQNWEKITDSRWKKNLQVVISDKSKTSQITAYHESDAGKTIETFNLNRTEP